MRSLIASLSFFSRNSRVAGQAGFRRHVNGRRGDEYRPWQTLQGQIYLGSDEFIEGLKPRLDGGSTSGEVPRAQREIMTPEMADIVRVVSTRSSAPAESFTARRGGPVRALTAYAARTLARIKLEEIAPWLGVKSWSVSRLARQGKRLVSEEPKWRRIWLQIESDVRKGR